MTYTSKQLILVCLLTLALTTQGLTQQASPAITDPTVKALMDRLSAAEARIHELEQKMSSSAIPSGAASMPLLPVSSIPAGNAEPLAGNATASNLVPPAEVEDSHAHSMEIPGGPSLKIRGFFDFNYGVGSIANPLVFPIVDNGCGTCGNPATPAHNTFQAGEFDLLITSALSEHLSFLGEIVLGPDNTNQFGVDIERYQLTYKANPYFSVSAGRFHTSIGYYNTAYHHGNWFSTAEGRPIMYLFEDSGGILPVHMVGLDASGLVPHTGELGLHWVAEVGNGLSSNPFASESVQNFYSDRNYKATNLAMFIKPEFLSGLQIGGSWYHDGINPSQAQNPLPLGEIRQNVESAYIVYLTPKWEFLNEGVLLSNHLTGIREPFRSPMAYSQAARRFGIYEPYFRFQYVRDNLNDPINALKGTYYGPSVGMRIDFASFAALKIQFNHLYQSAQLAGNGVNTQLAFTF